MDKDGCKVMIITYGHKKSYNIDTWAKFSTLYVCGHSNKTDVITAAFSLSQDKSRSLGSPSENACALKQRVSLLQCAVVQGHRNSRFSHTGTN
jgi:hypothetical protein